jgi:hypothetical protein
MCLTGATGLLIDGLSEHIGLVQSITLSSSQLKATCSCNDEAE